MREEEKIENKLYRSLVRIEEVGEDYIIVCVPAWDSNSFKVMKNRIWISETLSFDELREKKCPIRIPVKCTLGVKFHQNMRFHQWETENMTDADELAELKTYWEAKFNSDDAYYMGLTFGDEVK